MYESRVRLVSQRKVFKRERVNCLAHRKRNLNPTSDMVGSYRPESRLLVLVSPSTTPTILPYATAQGFNPKPSTLSQAHSKSSRSDVVHKVVVVRYHGVPIIWEAIEEEPKDRLGRYLLWV